ncbi:MAG: S1C family serine protease [Rhodospirillales bacterium]
MNARSAIGSAVAGCRRLAVATVAAAVMTASAPPQAGAEEINSKDIIDAVVGISSIIPDDARTAEHLGTSRSGSGIVIDDDGLVLTIGYLIMEATAVAVTDSSDALVPATLVAYDHNTGFGLLKAKRPLGIKPVKLGSSAALAEGAPVIVVSKGGPIPVMPARVAARREFAGYWEYLLEDAIFTVPPHPQFGGAALIDPSGRLVGVGSLIVHNAVVAEGQVPGNMFVPIDALKPIFDDLVEYGRAQAPPHPWLGVYTDENNGRVFVTRLAAGGPAKDAGIKPGDIIMGVGGRRVTGMADFFRKVWARGDAGTEVPIDVLPMGAGSLDIRTITVLSKDRHDWLKMNTGF